MPGSVLRALDHKVPPKWVLLLMLHCAGEKAEAPHGSAQLFFERLAQSPTLGSGTVRVELRPLSIHPVQT